MSLNARNATLSRLADVLGRSVFLALGLKESLQDERSALQSEDLQALTEALDNKTRCVAELKELEKTRAELASGMGYRAGPGQMDQLTREMAKDVTITGRWEHLLDIARECNDLNMRNGAIVQLRKRQAEAGLAVLRGESPTSETYSRQGAEAPGHGKRSLAEA